MFMELRNEVNHLLYLYFNSVGVLQRDYSREDIAEQVQAMSREIKNSKDRIYGMLDQVEKKAESVPGEDLPDREVLRDGLEFLDWFTQSALGQDSRAPSPKDSQVGDK